MTDRRRRVRLAVALGAVVTLGACGSDGPTPLIHRGNAVPVTTGSLTATENPSLGRTWLRAHWLRFAGSCARW